MKIHTPNPIPHTLALYLLFLIVAFLGCADIPDELRDEAAGKTFKYCVLDEKKMCLTGTFGHKDCSGKANNDCPYGSPEGCSESVFNPSRSFCYDGNVYQKCSGNEYNPTTHICEGYVAYPAKCGGSSYNPVEQRCQNGAVESECGTEWYGTEWYNISTQFCYNSSGSSRYSVHDKCNGNEYDPREQFCSGNSLYDYCGNYYNSNSTYDPATEFCYKNENDYYSVYNKCGGSEYDPATEQCCGSSKYTTSSQYCKNGTTPTQYDGSVTYSGQIYNTVVIGDQTWMAENLNYNATGNKCNYNQESNCDKYGRLYDWSTAMGFDAVCNSYSVSNANCNETIGSPHQGVCPDGWHIPSNAEWTTLINYVESEKGCSSCAGTHLKSASGWYNYSGIVNLDSYGFSALSGGYGYSDGSFGYVGIFGGVWWSASENLSDYAYDMGMYYYDEDVGSFNGGKSYLLSVRCLED